MEIPGGFRLQTTKLLALDGSLVGRGVIVRLGLDWFGRSIARKAQQQRDRHVYDYVNHVVRERDKSTGSMSLPLELCGTDEQAALGPWVLLEYRAASRRPFCGSDYARHEQVGKAIIPQCSPYRHCALMCLLVVSVP